MSIEADRVRNYKKNSAFRFDEIDYARAIATRAYDPSKKNVIREFIRMCTYQFKFVLTENKNSEMIFVYSYRGKGRKDYDYIFDQAESFATMANIPHDVYNGVYTFDLRNVFKIGKAFQLFWRFKKRNVEHPLYSAILVAQFTEFKTLFEEVIKSHNYKACVTFCDAHGVENIFTQLANKNGMKTATLQHGQYRILPKEYENHDIEVYENLTSDYLMAWGKVTQNEFAKVGIEKDRIILAGAIKEFSMNKKIVDHKKLGVFGVILCGNVYEKTNLAMIELANKIAKRYNMKYILRMHPKNNADYYINKCDKEFLEKGIRSIENYEYAAMVDFSILHMTGVLVELLSINSPMFIYSDEQMADIYKLEGATFSCLEEFFEIYKVFLNDESLYKDKQHSLYGEFNCAENLCSQYGKAYRDYLIS